MIPAAPARCLVAVTAKISASAAVCDSDSDLIRTNRLQRKSEWVRTLIPQDPDARDAFSAG